MGENAVGPGEGGAAEYRPDVQEAVKAPEAVLAPIINRAGQITASAVPVAVTPTQVRRPWRTTVRAVFQGLVALAVLFPVLVQETGLKAEDYPWLGIGLAVAAAITRIMALPQVEVFLRRFLPFLAATPKEK